MRTWRDSGENVLDESLGAEAEGYSHHDHRPHADLGDDVAVFRGFRADQAGIVGGLRVDPVGDRGAYPFRGAGQHDRAADELQDLQAAAARLGGDVGDRGYCETCRHRWLHLARIIA